MKKKTKKKKTPKTTPPHHISKQCRTSPCLRFNATAWAKLLYLCHRGDTEIGGFGIASTDDLLLVDEVFVPQQVTTAVTVAFEDESVADYFEDQVLAGRNPEQFGRIWIHTHPGDSPHPSSVDEETFARVFGTCDWAIMFILARGGATYTRLTFNTGPGGSLEIPVTVDFHHGFSESNHDAWESEYRDNICPEEPPSLTMDDWDLSELTEPLELTDDLDLYDEVEIDLF